MRSHVHFLSGLLGSKPLLAKSCHLGYQILEVRLIRGDQGFLVERHAMPREHDVEIQFLERVEGGDPFVKSPRCPCMQGGIPSGPREPHDFFFREIYDGVALGVAPPKKRKPISRWPLYSVSLRNRSSSAVLA